MLQQTRLANGVRIISQADPSRRSVSLGIWWLHGSRHQSHNQSGFVHLLEHLVFKGNQQFSSQQLSDDFEAMGGQINASTGRELTSFYGVVPAQAWPELLTRLSSMLLTPGFNQHDLELEREVVGQEMAMVEDDTEEWLEELAVAHVWPKHSIGWPILGDMTQLQRASVNQLKDYLRANLTGERVLIVATGGIDHSQLVEAGQVFASLSTGQPSPNVPVRFTACRQQLSQEQQQSYLLWLMPAPALYSPDYITSIISNHLVGGGAASRLFQRLREELALVYGIDSRLELYQDSGLWLIQTSCDPERQNQCRTEVEAILWQLAEQGPNERELQLTKAHLRSSLQLDSDDIQAQHDYLAQQVIYANRLISLDEQLEQISRVSATDVQAFIRSALTQLSLFEAEPSPSED
jgi:predicted Zn-dependent peptidase